MGKYLLKCVLLIALSTLLFPLMLWMIIPLEWFCTEHYTERVDDIFLSLLVGLFKGIVGFTALMTIIVSFILLPFCAPERSSQ